MDTDLPASGQTQAFGCNQVEFTRQAPAQSRNQLFARSLFEIGEAPPSLRNCPQRFLRVTHAKRRNLRMERGEMDALEEGVEFLAIHKAADSGLYRLRCKQLSGGRGVGLAPRFFDCNFTEH